MFYPLVIDASKCATCEHLNLFLFIPLFGVALRRVKWAALSSQKESAITKELEEALADNVPLVFGTLVTLTIPLMTWIACAELF